MMKTDQISDGSLKQLWKISSALMISFLSIMAMLFVDRLFLARYSMEALNAASSAGTLYWSFTSMVIAIASMGEVFVSQYNGAKIYKKLGAPVWQMIWFSILSSALFITIGVFGSRYALNHQLMNAIEGEYFRWNTYFAPCLVLLTAISSFYIGQGKTHIIKWLGLLGNGINVVLDYILIFGYGDSIPAMGVKGAAIATGCGIIIQTVIISILFLSKNNRTFFGTRHWHFNKGLFLKCLRIGAPPGFFVLFEMLGWTLFYNMMKQISSHHIIVASVIQSILILFLFFGFGLEKGTAAIAGNLIGSNRYEEINQLLLSGIKLSLIFTGFTILALGYFNYVFINLFINNEHLPTHIASDIHLVAKIKTSLKYGMGILIFYITLENIRWLINGILTAAGDTLFPMAIGFISISIFMILPTYIFVVKPQAPIETALQVWIVYSIVSTLCFAIRFKTGQWKRKSLIKDIQHPLIDIESESLIID